MTIFVADGAREVRRNCVFALWLDGKRLCSPSVILYRVLYLTLSILISLQRVKRWS